MICVTKSRSNLGQNFYSLVNYCFNTNCFNSIQCRNRIRQYPALVNCATIDWFCEWPRDALLEVAERCLDGLSLGNEEGVRCINKIQSQKSTKHCVNTPYEPNNASDTPLFMVLVRCFMSYWLLYIESFMKVN